MHFRVAVKLVRSRKLPAAVWLLARKGPLAGVSTDVGREVIRSTEITLAGGALKRLDASVLSDVSCKLI